MNANRLLAHYQKIADAPDAIPRLRRFVLELAVRGKLIEQDPNEESAATLLAAVKRSKLRECHASDTSGWLVAPVGVLLEFRYGKGMNASERLKEGPVPVFGSNGIVGYCETPLTEVPSIIVGRKGSAGALNLCDGPSWTTDVAYFVEAPSFFNLRYLLIGLKVLDLESLGKGVKPGLSRSEAYDLPMSVPPLAEQHRIVAKVDELMNLCDRLETTSRMRETTRDRLAAASLARLNEPDPDPDVFQNHATFVLDNLIPLTIRPDQIKALRQTILNLAVRGKLVKQDPNDEPASELLKRTAERKRQLKVKHHVVPLAKEERPFRLPVGWQWSRIGELCTKTGSGSTPRGGKNVYMQSGVPFLRSQNVYDDGLRMDDVAYVGPDVHARMTGTTVRPGDLLLNITGASMGRCCRVPEHFNEANVSQHVAIIRPAISEMSDFLHKLVLSPCFQAFIFDEQTGAGRGGLPKKRMDRIAVAVPPLAEQHRIVAKVDELMATCDRLETSLAAGNDARRRLLDALLHVALSPSNEDAPSDISAIAQDLPAKSPGATKAFAHPTPSDTSPE